jgi:phytoene synthase
MKANNLQKQIFKEASTTHYYSTLLFPKTERNEVTILYAFVRIIDDIVDEESDTEIAKRKLAKFKSEYQIGLKNYYSDNTVINQFIRLKQLRGIPDKYVTALFKSMEWDLNGRTYETIEELEEYMYGVAVVIGLMMNRIFRVDEKLDEYAFAQGYAAQWANIIRDIGIDLRENRIYVPRQELRGYGIDHISRDLLESDLEKFKRIYNFWIQRLESYLENAKPGYALLPKRLAVPIKTASDMYMWSVRKIYDDPFLLFDNESAVKPSKLRVFGNALKNFITI